MRQHRQPIGPAQVPGDDPGGLDEPPGGHDEPPGGHDDPGGLDEPGGHAIHRRLSALWPYVLLIAVWVLWATGIGDVALTRMNDLGLVSVLPWPIFASVGLLTLGTAVMLRARRPDALVMTLFLITLVFTLHAIPAVVEDVARSAVNWVHEGFIEYVRRTGAVAPQLDARYNWPGFFILAAFLAQAAGVGKTIDFANWAPVYFNLLFLLALAVIFRSQTRDPRLVWAALWMFTLGNWIGQDYFSPQAVAYFLDLAIVGAILTWFRVERPHSERVAAWLGRLGGRIGPWSKRLYGLLTPDGEAPLPGRGAGRAGLLVLLVIIFAFIAYSHQLTPFFLSFALLGLAVINRISARGLPIIFGVITVAWVSYMTVPFLAGHVASLLSEVGKLGETVGTNVVQRIQGSRDHQIIVTVRLAFTVAVWGVASLGAFVRFRDGRRDMSLIVLALAPLPLVGLQTYGGELVLRLYLFTLPMAAFFVAGLVYGRPGPPQARLRQVFAGVAALAMVMLFFVTRYGNERIDVMTATEVQAVERLYSLAPAGSLLMTASENLPWRFRGFEMYNYRSGGESVLPGDAMTISTILSDTRYPAAFLILTASQGAYAEVFGGLPPGDWDRFVASIRGSPLFVEVYRNADSSIFVPAGRRTPNVTP